MSVFAVILSIVLALVFLFSGGQKVVGVAFSTAAADHLGFPRGGFRVIGALEVAGAVGLLVGLAFRPLAIAAAIGLTLLMVGAVAAHLRAGDTLQKFAPAVVIGALAAVTVAVELAR